MNNQSQAPREESLLARLRTLIPADTISAHEALLVAEAQANRLRAAFDAGDGRFDTARMGSLPRLRIERSDLPTSGVTYWDGQRWNISVNSDEPLVRQRFTLLHEYKHVIDHGATARLYGEDLAIQRERAEGAADYFAGCVLMPRRAVLDLWADCKHSVADIAKHFEVSERAVDVRLGQLGVGHSRERCARPVRSHGGQQQFRVVQRKAVA